LKKTPGIAIASPAPGENLIAQAADGPKAVSRYRITSVLGARV